jgi:hypothetical protein
MARSYKEKKRISQPLYQRYRNTYRGPRSSQVENMEMNKILIDIKILEEKIEALNLKVYEDVRVFVNQVDPELNEIHNLEDDGFYYTFTRDMLTFNEYNGSPNPDYLEIPVLNTISGRLSRMAEKVKNLENKGSY